MGRMTARKIKKRKAREKAKRKELQRKQLAVQAYHGTKYRTDELIPVYLQTETAIYECFVMTERTLTDREVRTTLVGLISQIRRGMYPPDGPPETNGSPEGHVGLLAWNLAGRWQDFFREKSYPGRDKMIGVLRTILGSIETWGSPSPTSRGYLKYIEEFLQEAGVSVQQYSADELEAMGVLLEHDAV